MMNNRLYSIILELCALDTTVLPAYTGKFNHALFLGLIGEVEPSLAARLHDEQEYRPFTVSSLMGASLQDRDRQFHVLAGNIYRVRITLLDGGQIWECLSRRILEERQLVLRLGAATFQVERLLSTPASDSSGWAIHTTWQDLTAAELSGDTITMRFASPTAFSLGNRRFALFPEPQLVWDSLLRSWNRYAPDILQIEKLPFREFVADALSVVDYSLYTSAIRLPKFPPVGFVGTCTYLIRRDRYKQRSEQALAYVAALAKFSHFAGIGSSTTMGMGQARLEEDKRWHS